MLLRGMMACRSGFLPPMLILEESPLEQAGLCNSLPTISSAGIPGKSSAALTRYCLQTKCMSWLLQFVKATAKEIGVDQNWVTALIAD